MVTKKAFFITFLYVGVASAFDPAQLDMFIGQVYPSGNVYLKSFAGEGRSKLAWPAAVTLIPIGDGQTDLSFAQTAVFSKRLRDKVERDTVQSLYIPGAEGLDDQHQPCGLGEIKPRLPDARRIGSDFFETQSDHCVSNENIVVYRTSPSKYSFMVLAVTEPIVIEKTSTARVKRPLTHEEEVQVAREKGTGAIQVGCTTEPAYLDSAQQFFSVSLSSPVVTMRISSYLNPGCAGHLADQYILDHVNDDALLRSQKIFQYRGPM